MDKFTVSSQTHPENGTCLITLDGVPGEDDFDQIAAEFQTTLDTGSKRVVIELSTLQSPSTAVLGLLIDFGKSLAAEGGKLVLASPPRDILDLIELLGIKSVFAITAAPTEKGQPSPGKTPPAPGASKAP